MHWWLPPPTKRYFCNGIDLDWLVPFVQKGDKETAVSFFYVMNRLFKRILLYPMPTIAAISGHAFAGGAIMSCAFDFGLCVRTGDFSAFRRWISGIPFLPGMIALITKAIPQYKVEELHYTGKRATAEELKAHHIIMKACHIDDLMDEAVSFAKGLNKRREIMAEMKKRMYKDIVRAFDVDDPPVIESGMFHV